MSFVWHASEQRGSLFSSQNIKHGQFMVSRHWLRLHSWNEDACSIVNKRCVLYCPPLVKSLLVETCCHGDVLSTCTNARLRCATDILQRMAELQVMQGMRQDW